MTMTIDKQCATRGEETRDTCLICANSSLASLWHLDSFPTYMGCAEEQPSQDFRAEMLWGVCSRCGIVQLIRLPPVSLVYRHHHNEGIGRMWERHDESFAAFVAEHSISPVVALDRSSLSGEMLAHPILQLPSTGTFVHSHAMEHWRRPRDILNSIASCMSPGSRMILSIPDMDSLLRAGVLATLNFEHSFHLSNWAVGHLLATCGFEIIATESFAPHSQFLACERHDSHPRGFEEEGDANSAPLVKNTVANYVMGIETVARKVSAFDGPSYLFGAHVFSQYLLNLGLHEQLFNGILDNSEKKCGKRLYGTSLHVSHPRILQDMGPTMIVLRSGVYDVEIREGIRRIAGTNAIFC